MTDKVFFPKQAEAIQTLRRAGVRRAAVFGSVARGTAEAASDLDLLIDLDATKSLLDLVRLETDLEEQLGREVDLVTYRSLHPRLKDRILKQEQRIL